MKLYAPILDKILPAINSKYNTISFEHNPLVNIKSNNIKGYSYKIKNLMGNEAIITKTVLDSSLLPQITIDTSSSNLKVGQYYKLQIAYQASDNTIGDYSDIGIFKRVGNGIDATFNLPLKNNEVDLGQDFTITYTGDSSDPEEVEYGYRIDILQYVDNKEYIVLTSDEQFHYIGDNEDIYRFPDIPPNLGEFKIKMSLTTNNNLIISEIFPVNSNEFYTQYSPIPTETSSFTSYAQPNFEDGYMELFNFADNSTIYRYCWEDKKWISFPGSISKDFNIEQGKSYSYCAARPTDTTYVTPHQFMDFEDIFLWDGAKQFAIRYNPSVSTLNKVVNITKVDTIGSAHPYIFMNGQLGYKEFNIGGLIVTTNNEEKLFNNFDYIEDNSIRESTNSSATFNSNEYAIKERQEREFKLELLEWLNNGKPKLFRSGQEGNYIVILSNVSLTPEETSGRLYHTFSATATEIAPCTTSNLIKHGIINEIEDYIPLIIVESEEGSGLPFYVKRV